MNKLLINVLPILLLVVNKFNAFLQFISATSIVKRICGSTNANPLDVTNFIVGAILAIVFLFASNKILVLVALIFIVIFILNIMEKRNRLISRGIEDLKADEKSDD